MDQAQETATKAQETAIARTTLDLTQQVEVFAIENTDHLEYASSLLSEIIATRKRIADFFGPAIEAAHKAHKAVLAQKKVFDSKLEVAEVKLRGRMSEFLTKEEERTRVETANQVAQAVKEADEMAKEAEAAGDTDLARDLRDSAAAAVFTPKAEAPEGLSTREVWEADVFDPDMLITAVATGVAPKAYVVADLEVIGKAVRALKSSFSCPGIRVRKRLVPVSKRG